MNKKEELLFGKTSTSPKRYEFPICEECGYRHYKRAGAECIYYIKDQSDNRKEVDWK